MNVNNMKKKKKLKKYVVFITWYPAYIADYDDALGIWAYSKVDAIKALEQYYNPNLLDSIYRIKVYYMWFDTIWYRLAKKVPDKPSIEHL